MSPPNAGQDDGKKREREELGAAESLSAGSGDTGFGSVASSHLSDPELEFVDAASDVVSSHSGSPPLSSSPKLSSSPRYMLTPNSRQQHMARASSEYETTHFVLLQCSYRQFFSALSTNVVPSSPAASSRTSLTAISSHQCSA
jgi:hypothetical protein